MKAIARLAAAVAAAGAAPRPRNPIFAYEGADRMERIVAAAKKEGTLTLYTTIAEKDLPAILKPFEQKYGIKVNVWRAGTDKVLQRTVTEADAKRYEVDAIHFGSPEMEALSREKILQAVNSPVHKDLAPGSVPKHKEWAATILSVWVQAYNTNADQEGRPAEDLQGPPRPEVEGQARHRGEERRLVRHRRRPDGRRGEGPRLFPRARREERHLPAPRPHAAQQHGGLGRSAAGAHRLQLHARAGEEEGRADRLVRARAGGRALQRGRRRAATRRTRTRRCSSTSTCSAPTARRPW